MQMQGNQIEWTVFLKCYYDQKLTSLVLFCFLFFFFPLVFLSYIKSTHVKYLPLQVSRSSCPREVQLIEPQFLTSTGRHNKISRGTSWDGRERDVIQSRQQKQRGHFSS